MPDSALSADSDRNRCTAGSERMPKENAGRRPTLERPRNLHEERERREKERRQRMTNGTGNGRSVERRGRRATSGRRRKKRKSAKKRGSDKRLVGGSF